MTSELTVIEKEGQLLVSSIEVSEITGKRHANLLRDIGKYEEILLNSNLSSVDFFIKSTYADAKGENRAIYYLTRKGCDMVANKMTGEKGILFTATYVDRFYEMENHIKQQQPALPATYKEALMALVVAEEVKEQLLLENKQKQTIIEEQAPMVTFAEKISQKSASLNSLK
ncbi:Rha family transcriptional regulator [Peribacillus simplex]|uniref:Rha family transcriptional regulator n=1 Tax=Peribacillus simplex TaxID=1478 RepID=UPI003CFCBE1F